MQARCLGVYTAPALHFVRIAAKNDALHAGNSEVPASCFPVHLLFLPGKTMATSNLNIDRSTTALVLIDLQHGIVSMKAEPQPSNEIVARAKQLADAFREAKAPVVLVTVDTLGSEDALKPVCDEGTPPVGAPSLLLEAVANRCSRPGQ